MSIGKLQSFYGFTRMPFGRDLAPGMLHRHAAHGEAVARITWCVGDKALGVITGEVGAGKTVAVRAALAGLDQRPPHRHLPAATPPSASAASAPRHRRRPRRRSPASTPPPSPPRPPTLLAAEQAERGRTPVLVIDEAHLLDTRPARSHPHAHQPRHGLRRPVRLPAHRPAHPPAATQARRRWPPSTSASPSATT